MLHLVVPQRTYLKEQLLHGDSRAAVVVSVDPLLLVAAYTDELDCVALLRFPDSEFVEEYDSARWLSAADRQPQDHDLPIFDEDLDPLSEPLPSALPASTRSSPSSCPTTWT